MVMVMVMVMGMGEVYLFLFLNVIVVMYSRTSAYFRTFFFSLLKILHVKNFGWGLMNE